MEGTPHTMELEADCVFEAIKIAWSQDKNGFILKLSIHPDNVPNSVATDPLGTRYHVGLTHADEQVADTNRRAVSAAGLLCRNPVFHSYLRVKLDADQITTEATAAAALRAMLGVRSRSEIKGVVAEKMMEISDEFRKWAAHSQGSGKAVDTEFGL